jgi:16S rRNA (cytidine1402-2'-O)-methyltransferase
MEMHEQSGSLYVVATPIGNLADISLRALEVLRSIDLIAAEDTRHTRKLLSHYDIHKPLLSYHSQNMQQRGSELIKKLIAGEKIALVTDAGTPGISDPGSLLVRQALDNELQVISIPGPVALITALVISGLPTQPFAFLGFPPPRGAGRKRFFEAYAGLLMTIILYESPQRLKRTLGDLLTFWGDRRIAVARELTKKFEEQFRGTITEAQSHFAEAVKGELTLVVAGAEPEEPGGGDADEWVEQLEELLADGKTTVKEAAGMIAAKYRISRRDVYQKAIQLQRELSSE